MSRKAVVAALFLIVFAGVLAWIALTPVREQPRRAPVVIVPGYGGGPGMVSDITRFLRGEGFEVHPVAPPLLGTVPVEESADALAAEIDRLGAGEVDLIGFSAGGLIVRAYVKWLGEADRVRRVIVLGSPNHGAALTELLGGGFCTGSCRDMRIGSDFLRRLNAGDETPGDAEYFSIWTSTDQVVTPATSATLDGALNVRLQDVCPGEPSWHGSLLNDPLPMGLVLEALRGRLDAVPSVDQCARLKRAGAPASA